MKKLERCYVPDRFAYRRRPSRLVMVGPVRLGGGSPIVVQSMCTTPTQDVAATVRQCVSLAEAGCQIVRVTAPGMKDAQALRDIRRDFSAAGFAAVPLVADIHFMPAAALEAVEHAEKVRINPGNYADRKNSSAKAYTDAEYRDELERIAGRFRPLVRRAKELGRALRIGTNHGSLSERIVNRFGDTPAGMVESAMEFILIAEAEGFRDLVISMKSSRPTVMVQAYRLLCARLAAHGEEYPLHLGVTEAGDGEDGRAKGAAGIGALLEDGIGDTIRVSLTEPPEAEISVALALARRYDAMRERAAPPGCPAETIDPYSFHRRVGAPTRLGAVSLGGDQAPHVLVPPEAPCPSGRELPADAVITEENRAGAIPLVRISVAGELLAIKPGALVLIDLPDDEPARHLRAVLPHLSEGVAVGIGDPGPLGETRAYRLLAAIIDGAGRKLPICLALTRQNDPLAIAAIAGGLLVDGLGDAVYFPAAADPRRVGFTVLQALRARLTRADYVACPSCGRTLFDLMAVTAHIKEATGHLDGVTIAIMGCIVNGPGEMADADFGFVGSGPGKVDLYRGREKVRHGIPFATARDELVKLIKEAGRWREPE